MIFLPALLISGARSGAAMTRTFTTQASLIVLSTLSLAACATPAYPTHTEAPPPAGPSSAPTAAPAPPAPAASPTPAPAVTAAPSNGAPVETRPLPPVQAPAAAPAQSQTEPAAPTPAAPPPPSPAQQALPPDYTPPNAGAAEPETPPPPPRPSELSTYAPRTLRNAPATERLVATGRVVAATGMFREYTVVPHDHLDAIARDLQTTRRVLIEANHLKSPYNLKPGEHLKVPIAKAYEVQAGDNMTEIAKRFGVSAAELSDLNDLPIKGHLRPGDKLALPDNYHDHGPMRLPPTAVVERSPEYVPPAESRAPPPRPYAESAAAAPAGGPYVPSAEALAAAQRLDETRQAASSSTPQARPSPNPAETAPEPQGPPTPSQLAVANAGKGRFIWPVRGDIISPFGVKGLGRRNDGIDVSSPQGTEVKAAASGEVVYAGDQVPGFGNLVLVKHADGWVTAYAHLQSIGVQMRQTVIQGQMLGDVGSTGGVAQPELHFEIRYAPTPTEKAKPVDPLLILPK
jgi:murein DD-endopeptidase MepM/ murein hydrolase activator NlpD